MAWVELIPIARCRPSGGTFVTAAGRELAVFLLGTPPGVVVIDNSCPHAGGNLSGGQVEGGIVTCPWHHWQFELASGHCTHSDLARVRRYAAELRNGAVWADLPPHVDGPSPP